MEKTLKFYQFPNGNIACYNEKGEQVPELQRSFAVILVEKAMNLGYHTENIEFEMIGGFKLKPYMTEEGEINWEVKS